MLTKDRKLNLLNVIFVSSILISNVIAAKLISIFGFAVPAGVVVFPISFLMTDVINEVWGKNEAMFTVKMGFLVSIMATALYTLSVKLPPHSSWGMQYEYSAIMSSVYRIVLAGLLSYFISQTVDVRIFHTLKTAHKDKKLWIRNNVSTITSQLVDSIVFITVAFYGVVPTENIITMITVQWIVKLLLALLDTPFCYLLVKWAKKIRRD